MVINFVHTYIICFHIFLYLTLLLSIKIVLKLEKSGFFIIKTLHIVMPFQEFKIMLSTGSGTFFYTKIKN